MAQGDVARRYISDDAAFPGGALFIQQHGARTAGLGQLGAKRLEISPVVIRNTDVVAHGIVEAHIALGDHDRLATAEKPGVSLFNWAVEGPGLTLGEARGELHAPA